LIRLNANTGKALWQSYCEGLRGVIHSEYKHDASVELAGQTVRVISCGSAGTFVECLDAQTGTQVRRAERR
jgi:hypothetical protein